MQFSLKCETTTVCNLDEPRSINILGQQHHALEGGNNKR